MLSLLAVVDFVAMIAFALFQSLWTAHKASASARNLLEIRIETLTRVVIVPSCPAWVGYGGRATSEVLAGHGGIYRDAGDG